MKLILISIAVAYIILLLVGLIFSRTLQKIMVNGTIVLLVLCALFFVSLRVFSSNLFNITSSSMEPEITVNTLVYVKETDFNDINIGDIITYVNEDNIPVTHRVIGVSAANKTVTTKGDANMFADVNPVRHENIVGKVVFKIPYIGIVSEKINNIFNSKG